jgi:16S rRNA (cytidine1402-2'-O)-methyltransferase
MENNNVQMGTCYLVGTPIGNLNDITLRALEILRSVDIIAAEDTRHTLTLLRHYEINKPLVSYHAHNEKSTTEKIKVFLETGKSVAIVSDAGMPGISDPGAIAAIELRSCGFKTSVIPGPSAVISAVSLVGLPDGKFSFIGFLPDKTKDKSNLLCALKDSPLPIVLYSAPHNIDKDLSSLLKALGNRKIWVVKELTKVFETVYEGSLDNINIENKKGEFVIIVDSAEKMIISDNQILEEVGKLVDKGMTKLNAVREVSIKYSLSKNHVYALSLSKPEKS